MGSRISWNIKPFRLCAKLMTNFLIETPVFENFLPFTTDFLFCESSVNELKSLKKLFLDRHKCLIAPTKARLKTFSPIQTSVRSGRDKYGQGKHLSSTSYDHMERGHSRLSQKLDNVQVISQEMYITTLKYTSEESRFWS